MAKSTNFNKSTVNKRKIDTLPTLIKETKGDQHQKELTKLKAKNHEKTIVPRTKKICRRETLDIKSIKWISEENLGRWNSSPIPTSGISDPTDSARFQCVYR